MTASRAVGTAVGVLALLPFCAVGVVTAVLAVRAAGAHDWRLASFLVVFSLVFGGVGFGGLGAMFLGRRALAADDARRHAAPDEAWRWRDDWASGTIVDATGRTMIGAWIFAVLWNLISWPSAVLALDELHKPGNRAAFLALLFPAIGLGLLVGAVRATVRAARFGGSVLTLRTVPGVIGHSLAGTVAVGRALTPAAGFYAKLACIRRRTTGAGSNRLTTETVLWQEEQERIPTQRIGVERLSVPVAFAIPAAAAPFPAARNPGAAGSLTLFFLAWSGILGGLVAGSAPLLFIGVFALSDAALLYGVIAVRLSVTHVEASPEGVRVRSGLLGGRRAVVRADLIDVPVSIGMQAGQVPYYDIGLVDTSGRRTPAGSMIRNKHEAEWLADEIRRAVGLPGHSLAEPIGGTLLSSLSSRQQVPR